MVTVISTVLALIDKQVDRIPCESNIHNMNLQRLVLSQKHIAEVASEQPENSIYTDEASKFGNKVCGYHIRDKEGNYFALGMRDIVTTAGNDTLQTFKEVLADIASPSATTMYWMILQRVCT